MVSGFPRCSYTLRPACSLTRFLHRAFGTKGFAHFIASVRASAATGWSDSCRVGLVSRLSHWSPAPFHGALRRTLRRNVEWEYPEGMVSNVETFNQKTTGEWLRKLNPKTAVQEEFKHNGHG
jgi:hypothetical protein